MPDTPATLLVPLKLKALVIDDLVIDRAKPYEKEGFVYPGDGKWSSRGANYGRVVDNLSGEGPAPFFDAHRGRAEGLVPPDKNRPKAKDRGVYLHWVLPPALRHGGSAADLDYPVLPDQWVVVRFVRFDRKARPEKARGWFVDSGLLDQARANDQPKNQIRANLVLKQDGSHKAVRAGKVIPLEQLDAKSVAGDRTAISALGNPVTGHHGFTAATADNRNCLSFHDDLDDLRRAGKPPADMTLSYLVMGWYRDSRHEVLNRTLARLPAIAEFQVAAQYADDLNRGLFTAVLRDAFARRENITLSPEIEATCIQPDRSWRLFDRRTHMAFDLALTDNSIRVAVDPAALLLSTLKWQVDAPGADLQKARCIFHGLLTRINYWSPSTYKGPLLGYPGAPSAQGGYRQARRTLKIGVGATPQDALTSLVVKHWEAEGEHAALWKALEAVAYHRQDSLLHGWDESIRRNDVRQAAFRSVDGGMRWSIQTPDAEAAGGLPGGVLADNGPTAPRPTVEQVELLTALNRAQDRADRLARAIVSRQDAFYACWWRLCRALKLQEWGRAESHEARCDEIAAEIADLHGSDAGQNEKHPFQEVRRWRSKLAASLPAKELTLRADPAPRFWSPTDPVILIQNYGDMAVHRSPGFLPCRRHRGIAAAAELVFPQAGSETVEAYPEIPELVSILTREFGEQAYVLTALIAEAGMIEGAVSQAAAKLIPADGYQKEADWKTGLDRLAQLFDPDADHPAVRMELRTADGASVTPADLGTLWSGQPWSPLYLDWDVTWYPTPPADLTGEWSEGGLDFQPAGKPPVKGHNLRGRTMMTPVDRRVLDGPLDDLRRLLKKEDREALTPLRELLADWMGQWDLGLRQIQEGGLLGQALDGIHQALRQRDITRPLIQPTPDAPWQADPEARFGDAQAAGVLQPPVIHNDHPPAAGFPWAPPAAKGKDAPPAVSIRAGCLVINELWMVDDFGQWVDLRLGSSAGGSHWIVLNPHLRWPRDKGGDQIALPPRLLAPTRLNFRLTGRNQKLWRELSADSPICGWIYFNYLDEALCICDGDGRLLGELSIADNQKSRWRPINSQVPAGASAAHIAAPSDISDPDLAALVDRLLEPQALEAMLDLIDQRLTHIRPGGTKLHDRLAARPLALVRASLGLELYGETDIVKNGVIPSFPVHLGDNNSPDDGLVGFFPRGMTRIVPAFGDGTEAASSEFVADPATEALSLSAGQSHAVVLLMDPTTRVGARTGILPAKSLALPPSLVDETLDHLESSFQVGPILLPGGRPSLTAPFAENGTWRWDGGDLKPVSIDSPESAIDFSQGPPTAAAGRLILERHQSEE